MKEIELTQGKVAIVDDEDYEKLNQFRWYAVKKAGTYYAMRTRYEPRRETIRMHREILGDIPDDMQVDHIDGDGLNNQKANLRIVTNRQNSQNRHIEKSSRYPGVTWHKAGRKWQAYIRINGKQKYLGLYLTEKEAFQAYKGAVDAIGEVVLDDYEEEELYDE